MPRRSIVDVDGLQELIERVFEPRAGDRGIAILVDLPGGDRDDDAWRARRELARDWYRALRGVVERTGLGPASLFVYDDVGANNADLPDRARRHTDDPGAEREVAFESVFREHSILFAMTEYSTTAPLKNAARTFGFRAATMPGFAEEMLPALALDFREIHDRCEALRRRLDAAEAAEIVFEVAGRHHTLCLDLRFRTATASSGRLTEPGMAGNLPSGETYIVPYEGERADEPSRTRGTMPLQLGGEILHYRIEANRVVEVVGEGPRAEEERRMVAAEPGYANVAELGLGVLAEYGIRPIGELMLDEKLGLHVALGRSDHFGGVTGPDRFSAPERVVHIDRVYLPEIQPAIRVPRVALSRERGDGGIEVDPLMADGAYV